MTLKCQCGQVNKADAGRVLQRLRCGKCKREFTREEVAKACVNEMFGTVGRRGE